MQTVDSEERYQELAEKWLNDTITATEKLEFDNWYNAGQDTEIHLPESFKNEEDHKNRIYSAIDKQISINRRLNYRSFQKWSIAASIIIVLSVTLYLYYSQLNRTTLQNNQLVSKPIINITTETEKSDIFKSEILAGPDKAILTLDDGTKIILDDAESGILANIGGNNIRKTVDGELVFTFSKSNSIASGKGDVNIRFNIIETPKRGKFQVKLSDGSKVWLNAASSLRFPTAFTGNKRQVQLTGEAYFEVAPDSTKMFEVITQHQSVQVLGTHFNINAYLDEPSVNTTLLEGSVKISDLRSNSSQLLKPGEQAQFNEKIEVVNIKNVGEVVAWKDGFFQFNQADIQTVMRQIERWYDVTVRYEGALPTQKFGGEIERSLSLLQVIKILEGTNLHFRLEGRELIVTH